MNNIITIIAFLSLIIGILIHQILMKTNEIEYETFELEVNDLKSLKLR